MSPKKRSADLALLAIVAAALLFRLTLLPLMQKPGLHDPAHYFNLGRRLAQGQGFTIDYLWHYARLPEQIPHAIDHWMPLAGLAAAAGIKVGGASFQAAVALFVLVGSAVPALVYAFARQLRLPSGEALMAAALAAALPDIVWNSLRTDTTILNMALVAAGALCLNHAVFSGRQRYFALCGLLFGLAYMTRNDSILLLPMLCLYFVLARRMGAVANLRSGALRAFAMFALTVAPWLLRNWSELGALSTSQIGQMPWLMSPVEPYIYGTELSLASLLERHSWSDLLAKRLFELLAACKQMLASLDFPLAILAPAGCLLLVKQGDWRKLFTASPALIWTAGILVAYPILAPVYAQSGSFEKAFLSGAPLFIPLGIWALSKIVRRPVLRWIFIGASLLWLGWGSYDSVKRDALRADAYYGSIQVLVDALAELPDRTGDGEIRLMSQDPFVMSVYGYASIMTPLASREDTLELARRYAIDYMLMPADRLALDRLYLGEESDPRFQLAAHLADAGEIPFELYQFADQP